jgi:hypothetical protein
VKVTIRIHVDDYHDTREAFASDEQHVERMRADLAKRWEIPVERVRCVIQGDRAVLTVDE